MKILKREFEKLPGVGKEEWDIGQITISVTAEHLREIKSVHGVDATEMIKDAIANEVYQNLARVISKTARNKRPVEIKWIKESAYWLSDLLLKSKPKFIITNVKVGMGLQTMEQFNSIPLEKSFPRNGSLYMLGNFDKIPVYVDPNMLFSEDELAIIENDFVEYQVDEDTVKIVTEGTKPPRITLSYKYKISNARSSLYQINNVEI
jgi:hypothetical protein